MMDEFKPGYAVVVIEHEPDSLERCGLGGLEEEITSRVWFIERECYEEEKYYQNKYINYKKYYIQHGDDRWWVLEKDLRLIRRG